MALFKPGSTLKWTFCQLRHKHWPTIISFQWENFLIAGLFQPLSIYFGFSLIRGCVIWFGIKTLRIVNPLIAKPIFRLPQDKDFMSSTNFRVAYRSYAEIKLSHWNVQVMRILWTHQSALCQHSIASLAS